MNTLTYTLPGDVSCDIVIVENTDGTLTFTITALEDEGTIADLNAFYLDMADDSKAEGLTIVGDDVTGTALEANSVTKVGGSYTNINGEVAKDYGKFDVGVRIGSSGIAEDDIQTTTFTMSHPDGLSLEDFAMQDFAVRLTSVGNADGDRDGSLKLGGTFPEEPEEETVNTANNDSMTVSELNDFNELDEFGNPDTDMLDFNETSLLANDTTDGGAYTGSITAVNGQDSAIEQIVYGSDGGRLIVYADGSVDFSAYNDTGTNDFEALNEGDTAITTFDYSIEGGSTATLTVTVEGYEEFVPPPIDPELM